MKPTDRFLIGALAAGIWTLVALQLTSVSQTLAQQTPENEQAQETVTAKDDIAPVHASEIVGLSALIEKSIRDNQARPQSAPGLEQYVKSIVRRCRVSGSVRGERITSASISC